MKASVNGTELYYEMMGEGRPIMFMHGGLGYDHTYFLPWMKPLADDFQIILYDHRGNGRSERPESLSGVTHETWAADAEALRQYLGLGKMVLVGHSYGAFLALEYALRYQQNLAGLIPISSAPDFSYMELILANAKSRTTPEIYEQLFSENAAPLNTDADIIAQDEIMLPLYFKDPEKAKLMEVGEIYSYSIAANNHSSNYCAPFYNVTDRLNEIKVPTLVLSGIDDWITPAEKGKLVREGIPGSQMKVFENSGHFPFIEEQEEFIRVVRDWVKQLPE